MQRGAYFTGIIRAVEFSYNPQEAAPPNRDRAALKELSASSSRRRASGYRCT